MWSGSVCHCFQPRRVTENDGENVVEIVRNSAGERTEAFHFLRLHQLLLEPLSFRVVEKITLEFLQLALFVETPKETRHHINRFAIALAQFHFVRVDRLALPNEIK